ncbi:DUF647 domain-containing protein [Nannizzia gypsea CBS 118893]|uniref:DUF647 domain-containing protein n=1 Tax=Arthroderma gypseum (strain ATCC MYA-4604 / CBS 118893) TaxID=535722 RepID=E5R2M8_ARTGP|nr:DUF647 domain-containing protein [Nannizzia gypsea CBS 118893]EFQ98686.1 DUF647 domain-containing protein [Nannizzia gypsea CBS 118893]
MAPATNAELIVKETNEVGTTVKTYVCPSNKLRSKRRADSVEIILPPQKPSSSSYLTSILNVFLPVGYPHSVTDDYIESSSLFRDYEKKELTSLISGLTSSILKLNCWSPVIQSSVGVGDATASPTAALLLNVLQESMGRIATILFAHRLGTSLEPECKMYRLAADLLNDSAIVLDCMSPAFPKPVRVGLLSLSSVLRALCGVAAGSSKASLSAHFARWGNLGELNAKDSSQETVISLFGMLVGSVVVSYISSPLATWIALILLLIVHLGTNHAAVRAVKMTTLNRQRANIVFSYLFEDDRVLTPAQASEEERIFETDGVLRWKAKATGTLGICQIGVSLEQLLLLLPEQVNTNAQGSSQKPDTTMVGASTGLSALLELFKEEEYILYFSPAARRGAIVLKAGATPQAQLKAWSHALLVSRHLAREEHDTAACINEKQGGQGELSPPVSILSILRDTLREHTRTFVDRVKRLEHAGWQTDIASLETKPGRRVHVSV